MAVDYLFGKNVPDRDQQLASDSHHGPAAPQAELQALKFFFPQRVKRVALAPVKIDRAALQSGGPPPAGQIWKNYILAGGRRVALREYTSTSSTVYFLVADHLGSTRVVTQATGALTGNPSFWMVHTANLYATNTHVSADGTISTTWKVEDQFDYLPAWDDHFRTGSSYWAYNSFAQLIAPIYHGLLQAEPLSTNACWNQTHPPEEKLTPK